MSNLCSFIFQIMQQVLLLLITYKSASKRSRILVITQIRTFSLNLSTSNKNFQTTKYSLERSPQKELEDQKKIFFEIFQKNIAF